MGEFEGTERTAQGAPGAPTCRRCSATVGAHDSFCSRCGSPLPPATGPSKAYQHWRWIIVSALGALIVIAATAAFATLWRQEAADHRRAGRDLRAAQARLAVLQRVDPLLSSVLVLRRAAAGIPGVAATFAADSAALERDLTRLSSAVLARTRVTLSLVDRVNAELAALRTDGVTLARAGVAYARFSSRAAAFTTSIRTLLARAQ